MHLFVAAILLLRESTRSEENGVLEFHDEIETAIAQLDGVASQSALSLQATTMLRDLLDGVIPLQT